MIILISIRDAVLWIIFAAFFGLTSMWIKFGTSYFQIVSNFTFDYIILHGFIAYFCNGISLSIALNFFFNRKKNSIISRAEIFLYIVFPLFISLFVYFIGTLLETVNNATLDIDKLRHFQIVIICMTVFYALISKTRDYYNNKKIVI